DPGPGDPSVSDPAEDGSSTHPFDAIQEAIPLAIPGDVILVADGVYTGVGNTEIDFAGRPVLLCSAGGPSACTIDGQGAARAFIMQSGETPETRVEGFTIVNGYADIVGGAIYCEDSNPTVADCYIINCTAPFGGALRCLGGSPTLLRCTIAGNSSADDGGALNCYMGSLTVSDCVLHNNWTDDDGGAICCNSGQLTIRNSTFSRNGAGQMGGAVFCGADTDAVITNCILGEDTAAVGAEIALSGGIDIPTLTVAYSDVQDGEYGVYIQGGGVLNWGTGNIVADPLFFDPDNGDFHLAPGSACIDAGDPGFVADPGEMDIDRELRTWNERVDMGGDEFGSHHYGDVNCNGVINGFDIDAFVLALDGPGAYDAAYPDCDIMLADVNGDGAVNGFDIDAFVELLM
ncbi:MAG: hypothetical protein KKB50_14460, partial [Planctomycetes bacterium]|nr:hypothetical protein [Planctomycetota bacterium]